MVMNLQGLMFGMFVGPFISLLTLQTPNHCFYIFYNQSNKHGSESWNWIVSDQHLASFINDFINVVVVVPRLIWRGFGGLIKLWAKSHVDIIPLGWEPFEGFLDFFFGEFFMIWQGDIDVESDDDQPQSEEFHGSRGCLRRWFFLVDCCNSSSLG